MSTERSVLELRRDMMQQMGIVSFKEQERLIDIARRCSRFGGVMGAGWAVYGSPAGLPGVVSGFLSGWVAGTASCVAINHGLKQQLQKLAREGLP